MPIATFDGYTIPYVHATNISREVIGEQTRTTKAKMRRDTIDTKRTWELETRPMKKSDADNLIDYLDSINWGSGSFNMDELSSPVTAYIDDFSEERIQFEARDGSGWQNDGRKLTLTVIER